MFFAAQDIGCRSVNGAYMQRDNQPFPAARNSTFYAHLVGLFFAGTDRRP
jgi:hypothetical protein